MSPVYGGITGLCAGGAPLYAAFGAAAGGPGISPRRLGPVPAGGGKLGEKFVLCQSAIPILLSARCPCGVFFGALQGAQWGPPGSQPGVLWLGGGPFFALVDGLRGQQRGVRLADPEDAGPAGGQTDSDPLPGGEFGAAVCLS